MVPINAGDIKYVLKYSYEFEFSPPSLLLPKDLANQKILPKCE